MTWAIKGWAKFQHFKDRTPPWVKLYRDILDDPDWHELPGDASKILVMLWVIASEDETKQGLLPESKKLAFRLRITEKSLKTIMSQLIHWVIQIDINMISEGYQSDAPERAPEETETETEVETEKRRAPRFDAQAHLVEIGVPAELSADWIKTRKTKKAEVTKAAIDGIASEAGKAGLSLADALRECCSRGWAGFKADWMVRDGASARGSPAASIESRNKANTAGWVPPEMRQTA